MFYQLKEKAEEHKPGVLVLLGFGPCRGGWLLHSAEADSSYQMALSVHCLSGLQAPALLAMFISSHECGKLVVFHLCQLRKKNQDFGPRMGWASGLAPGAGGADGPAGEGQLQSGWAAACSTGWSAKAGPPWRLEHAAAGGGLEGAVKPTQGAHTAPSLLRL